MNVNFFKYYEYLDCKNPIGVEATIASFNYYRRRTDMITLKRITEEVMELPDFQIKPWTYEIELNKACYTVLKENRYKDGIKDINDFLQKIDPKYSKMIIIANFHVLLSTCYQMERDFSSSKQAILSAGEILNGKQNIMGYEQTFIAVKISIIGLHYLLGELDEVISEGTKLLQYQRGNNLYERIHYTIFYLAFTYYKKGLEEEGLIWFIKGLSLVILSPKVQDMFYLAADGMFEVIVNDLRIPKELIRELKREYGESLKVSLC